MNDALSAEQRHIRNAEIGDVVLERLDMLAALGLGDRCSAADPAAVSTL
jgi:hypothetical protein